MKKKRIFAIHLLNDFSGSPLVLKQALEVINPEHEIHLYTATPSGEGVLSNIPGVQYHKLFYRWHPNKLLTLIFFLWSQALLFIRLLSRLHKTDTVYINTLLPFGAAIAARCKGAKVIYHVHEVSLKPRLLKQWLVTVAQCCAARFIFVSQYVQSQFQFDPTKTIVIHNSLSPAFIQRAVKITPKEQSRPFTVLMLCSLKTYKGIKEFIALARQLPQIHFVMVLNASKQEVMHWAKAIDISVNCEIYAVHKDPLPFYQQANLVINLSLPDQWIETFGMTILEGMYSGLPAIVPQVGGVTELITHGREGIQADAHDIDGIARHIMIMATDRKYYQRLAEAARTKAWQFSPENFSAAIQDVFTEKAKISVASTTCGYNRA